jgi:hypothetical protein
MTLRNLFGLLLVSIFLFTLPSCGKDKEPEIETTPQTLLFYFVGTDLDRYNHLRNNRAAIKAALNYNIQGKSRVVIFHQNGQKKQGDIVELQYKDGLCQETVLSTVNLPDKMDAAELGNILSQMMQFAPAKTYSLIIGSHGLGWIPIGAEPESSAAIMGKEGKAHILTHEDLWSKDGNIVTRFLGDGDTNPENSFNTTTLSQAIASTGQKMEYILFDACFMANVEALYDLRHSAKYIVASACEIMGAGFPYIDILPLMLQNNGTSYDLDKICEAYYLDYKDDVYYRSGAVALVDCSQLDALAKAMKSVNSANKKEYNIADLQPFEQQTYHVFFDLGDYVDNMCDDANAKEAFDKQMNLTIVKKYTPERFYSAYPSRNAGICELTSFCGISTSAPSILYRSAYEQMSWYKATN